MKLTLSTIDKIYKIKEYADPETMKLLGYEFVENLFVDSSGFGQDDEPALTKDQMKKRLSELLTEYGTLTAKLTGVGMFQVNIGLYRKIGKGIARRLSSNVLEINKPEARIVRLYNTDIVKFKDNKIELDNGGYETRTTAKWMNRVLPNYLRVYQKNWKWFVDNSNTGETIKFDGSTAIISL